MVDLSALSTINATAQSLANLVLVTPQAVAGITPQLPSGSTGNFEAETFLFDYEGENSSLLEADITDHFVEDNTAIQDQVALKPLVIMTQGYVGELNDVVPAILQPLKTLADKLTVLSPFVPVITSTALIAYNIAAQELATANLVAGAAVSAWGSLLGPDQKQLQDNGSFSPVQTKQQLAYAKFFGYYQARQRFQVRTPWAAFNNMVIKSMRVVQDEETRMVSTFELTFKQLQFANTSFTSTLNIDNFINPARSGASSQKDNGIISGQSSLSLSSAYAKAGF